MMMMSGHYCHFPKNSSATGQIRVIHIAGADRAGGGSIKLVVVLQLKNVVHNNGVETCWDLDDTSDLDVLSQLVVEMRELNHHQQQQQQAGHGSVPYASPRFVTTIV
jgi:hypothetical protein